MSSNGRAFTHNSSARAQPGAHTSCSTTSCVPGIMRPAAARLTHNTPHTCSVSNACGPPHTDGHRGRPPFCEPAPCGRARGALVAAHPHTHCGSTGRRPPHRAPHEHPNTVADCAAPLTCGLQCQPTPSDAPHLGHARTTCVSLSHSAPTMRVRRSCPTLRRTRGCHAGGHTCNTVVRLPAMATVARSPGTPATAAPLCAHLHTGARHTTQCLGAVPVPQAAHT